MILQTKKGLYEELINPWQFYFPNLLVSYRCIYNAAKTQYLEATHVYSLAIIFFIFLLNTFCAFLLCFYWNLVILEILSTLLL